MSKKTTKAKRNKAPELPAIADGGPGVGLPSIPELDEKALNYIELDDELKSIKELHESAKLELTACLDAHADELGRDGEGTVRYYSGEVCVSAEPGKRRIKVTQNGGAGGEHEEN